MALSGIEKCRQSLVSAPKALSPFPHLRRTHHRFACHTLHPLSHCPLPFLLDKVVRILALYGLIEACLKYLSAGTRTSDPTLCKATSAPLAKLYYTRLPTPCPAVIGVPLVSPIYRLREEIGSDVGDGI